MKTQFREVQDLFIFRSGYAMPCNLTLRQKLWWRFTPGTVINVRWPTGPLVVDHTDECMWVSSDPNDHYRPFLEQHVGRQGWDWDWGMADRDATDNRLTIKIRRKHEQYATMLAVRWS